MANHQSLATNFANLDLICITPNPRFARLDRSCKGMFRAMEVFSGMLVLGRIAAPYVAADQAHPQMDPAVSHFYALVTLVFVGLSKFDLIGMSALCCHRILLL